MTEKQLKKLNRRELLELLIVQTRRAEALEKELAEVNQKLSDRRIAIENVGSIAEAALQLSGVFEAAQNASEQYLENARRIQQESREEAERILQQAREEALRITKGVTLCDN